MKLLKLELRRKLLIRPILDFGYDYHKGVNSASTRNNHDLIATRRRILSKSPIDWDSYHQISVQILDILPNTINSHPNIARLIDLSEIKSKCLGNTYLKKGAYIYGIFNFTSHESRTYIGQTGMRRRLTDKRKRWQDMERAPLQRMREHIQAALSNNVNTNNDKKSSTLYKFMKHDPAAWIMVPLAYIPYNLRSKAKYVLKITGGLISFLIHIMISLLMAIINNACTSSLEKHIYNRVNNLTLSRLVKFINSKRVTQSTLE